MLQSRINHDSIAPCVVSCAELYCICFFQDVFPQFVCISTLDLPFVNTDTGQVPPRKLGVSVSQADPRIRYVIGRDPLLSCPQGPHILILDLGADLSMLSSPSEILGNLRRITNDPRLQFGPPTNPAHIRCTGRSDLRPRSKRNLLSEKIGLHRPPSACGRSSAFQTPSSSKPIPQHTNNTVRHGAARARHGQEDLPGAPRRRGLRGADGQDRQSPGGRAEVEPLCEEGRPSFNSLPPPQPFSSPSCNR